MGMSGISKSQVSRPCEEIDIPGALDGSLIGERRCLWADYDSARAAMVAATQEGRPAPRYHPSGMTKPPSGGLAFFPYGCSDLGVAVPVGRKRRRCGVDEGPQLGGLATIGGVDEMHGP